MSFPSLLFLYRLRAVYSDSKIIKGFFNLLWVVLVASSVSFHLRGMWVHTISFFPQGNICLHPRSYLCLCRMFIALGDQKIDASKLVYTNSVSQRALLIPSMTPSSSLWSLTKSSQIHWTSGDNWKARARPFYTANGLPRTSKALQKLQSGQLPYLWFK